MSNGSVLKQPILDVVKYSPRSERTNTCKDVAVVYGAALYGASGRACAELRLQRHTVH